MPYELTHEDFVLCGESLTVYQASNEMDMERSFLISEANKQPEAEDTRGQYVHYLKTLLYPSLVACTTGNVPTLPEFLANVPVEETKKWISIAQRLNPAWFTFLLDEDEATVEKKEQ